MTNRGSDHCQNLRLRMDRPEPTSPRKAIHWSACASSYATEWPLEALPFLLEIAFYGTHRPEDICVQWLIAHCSHKELP